MNTTTTTRLHTFRDFVALSTPETPQLYLTPKHARQLARELVRFAQSAERGKHLATRNTSESGPARNEGNGSTKPEVI